MSPGRVLAAVVAVLLVALVAWRRRRLGTERLVVSLLAAAALGIYASGVLSELPDPEKLIEDLAHALGGWTYALVGVMAFAETGVFVGLVAPGEFTIILGGVIAGQGEIDIVYLLGLAWLCCVLGDSTSFLIGRRLGRDFLLRHGGRFKLTPERLTQVEDYFDRHGGKTVILGRWIGFVRAMLPFVVGTTRMPYRRFLPYSIVGTGVWSTFFCLLGYVFYRSFERLQEVAGRATVAFGLVVGTIVVAIYAYKRLRKPEDRRRFAAWVARQAERPALRPLAAVARPVWRRALGPAWRWAWPRLQFLGRRLTPGELGLELTTLVAITGVGAYVFALYAVILAGDPGVTPFDREALDVSEDIRMATLVDIAKVVTGLGSFPVTCTLVIVAALALAFRRRPRELLALVFGFALVVVAVQLAKAGIGRPRPPEPLVAVEDTSFPSGHAAYATAWIATAVVAAWLLRGAGSRAAIVVAGIAVCAAVGLTRIYLHVHYWSDVVGGWALGVACFGLCATIALVVGYLRQNSRRAAAPAAAHVPYGRQ